MQEERERQVTLMDYVRILLRGKWIILLSFFAVVGSTAYFTFKTRPVYEATTSVIIDQQRGVERRLFDITGYAQQTTMVNNQVEILKSRHLAESVIRTLSSSPVADSLGILMSPFEDKPPSFSQIVRTFQENMSIEPVRDTDIIRIKIKGSSPWEAAYLANTVAGVYQNLDKESSRGEISEVMDFLQEQLEKKGKDLRESEETLRRFTEEEKVVSLPEETQEMVTQLVEFESLYNEAKTDLETYRRRLGYLKEQFGERKESLERDLAQISSPLILELRNKIAESEGKLAVYRAQGVSEQNPEVRREKNKIASLKEQMAQETQKLLLSGLVPRLSVGGTIDNNPLAPAQELLGRIIETETQVQAYTAKTSALKEIVDRYSKRLETLPDKSLKLARLERSKKLDENLYIMMKEKYEESRISRAGQIGKIRIVDRAAPPEYPISPKKKLNLILAALVGLGLGIGVTFLIEYLDTSVRSLEDVETLGLSVLGTVPVIETDRKGSSVRHKKEIKDAESRYIAARLVTHLRPKSPVSEAYRTLRTNIQYARPDTPLKTILVTSPGPKEGKSTSVANLAITMAHMGTKTLLVDSDLRRPVLHNIFGFKKEVGLTNYLVGKTELEEILRPTEVENLTLVTCGTLPPNPSELLGSGRMKDLVEELKNRYEVILFDSPPVIAVTDAAVLGSILDGVVLIIRFGQTDREATIRANTLLQNVRAETIGALLNDVNVRSTYGYYRYYYYYYYYYYYGEEEGKKKRRRKRV